MADVPSGNGRNGGNRVFSDKAIAYAMASVAAAVFGTLMTWQLTTSIDTKERVVRIEATTSGDHERLNEVYHVVFPPAAAFTHQH